jgi:hypothetical protein
MAKLPFVVQPRLKPIIEQIGNEDIGIIEIERRGFLSAGEKAFLQQGAASDDISVSLIALVRKAAKEFKISVEEAHKTIMAIMTNGEETDLYSKFNKKYSQEIDDLTLKAINTDSRRIISQASCMLLYRVDSELDIEDIMQLHPDLLTALAELCQDEEIKSTERLIAQETPEDKQEPDAESFEALEKK